VCALVPSSRPPPPPPLLVTGVQQTIILNSTEKAAPANFHLVKWTTLLPYNRNADSGTSQEEIELVRE